MKKLLSVMLAVAVIFASAEASQVQAAVKEGQSLYKLTPITDYENTAGRFIVLGDIPIDTDLETYLKENEDAYFAIGTTAEYLVVSDAVKVIAGFGVDIHRVDLTQIKLITKPLKAGMYLVGNEIKPGTFKLTGKGQVKRLSNATIDRNADIILGVVVEGKTTYITVKKTDFALQITGDVVATKVK